MLDITDIRTEIIDNGFTIEQINIKTFEDNGVYKICTIELKECIDDYTKLLKIEKQITQKLELSTRNIILELL